MERPAMMKDEQRSTLSRKERIDILMKEYDTLRTEIFHRTNSGFAIFGLLGGLGGYTVFTTKEFTPWNLSYLAISAVLLLFLRLEYGRLAIRASRRIAQIEEQVNTLAGETLLVWDTRQLDNIYHRLFRTKRPEKAEEANVEIER
jgi:hypothetical protein